MALRMKWTQDGADLIGARPRDGSLVRAIDEPREPRHTEEHVHLWVHSPPAPVPLGRTHDATVSARPAARRGDQAQEPAGEVICRLGRDGRSPPSPAGGAAARARGRGRAHSDRRTARPSEGPDGPPLRSRWAFNKGQSQPARPPPLPQGEGAMEDPLTSALWTSLGALVPVLPSPRVVPALQRALRDLLADEQLSRRRDRQRKTARSLGEQQSIAISRNRVFICGG
jgi:hypothetical protein